MLESERMGEECSPLTKGNPRISHHLDNSIVQLGQEACSLINRIDKISLLISSQQLLRKLHGELECLVLRLHSRPLRPKLSSSSSSMIPYKEVRSHSRSRSKDKKKGRNYSLRCFSPEPEIQRYSRSCIGSPLGESKRANGNIDLAVQKQSKEMVDLSQQSVQPKEDSLVCVPFQMQYVSRQGVYDNESRVKSKECLMKLKELDERSEEEEEEEDNDNDQDEGEEKDRTRQWNDTHRQRNCSNVHNNRNNRHYLRNNRWEKSSNSSSSFLDCENDSGCALDGNHYRQHPHHSASSNNKEEIEQLNEILKNLSISIQAEVAHSSDAASIREVEHSMDIIINKLKNI